MAPGNDKLLMAGDDELPPPAPNELKKKETTGPASNQPPAQQQQPSGQNGTGTDFLQEANAAFKKDLTVNTSPQSKDELNAEGRPQPVNLQKVINDKTGGQDVRDYAYQQYNALLKKSADLHDHTQLLDEIPKQGQFQDLQNLQKQIADLAAHQPVSQSDYAAINKLQEQVAQLKQQPFKQFPAVDADTLGNNTPLTVTPETAGEAFLQNKIDAATLQKNLQNWNLSQNLNKNKTVGDLEENYNGSIQKATALQKDIEAQSNDLNGVVKAAQLMHGFQGNKDGVEELNWVGAGMKGFAGTFNDAWFGAKYLLANDSDRLTMLKRKIAEENILYPQTNASAAGDIAETSGSILPYLIPGVAEEKAALTGGAKLAGTAGSMLSQGLLMGLGGGGRNALNTFQEIYKNTNDEQQALTAANTTAKGATLTGGLTGAVLFPLFGSLGEKLGSKFIGDDLSKEVTANGTKNLGMMDYLKYTLPKNTIQSLPLGFQSYVDNEVARSAGSDRDALQGVGGNIVGGVVAGGVLDGLVHAFGKLGGGDNTSARNIFLNTLSKYVPTESQQALDKAVQSGGLDPARAEQIKTAIQNRADAQAGLPDNATPKQIVENEPKVLRIQGLQNLMKDKDASPVQKEAAQGEIDRLTREVHESLGTPLTPDENLTLGELQSRDKEKDDDGKLKNPLKPAERELMEHLEARQNQNLKISEFAESEKDKKIAGVQSANNLPVAPELTLSDDAKNKLQQIENGEIVTNNTRTLTNKNLQPLVDELNGQLKALTETRDNPNRRFTREQIDTQIADVKNKIDTIETARNADGVAHPINFNPSPQITIEPHGDTKRDQEHKISGQTSEPLTDAGKTQAVETGKQFKAEWDKNDTPTADRVIVTSPRERAEETTDIAAKESGAIAAVDNNLDTWDVGKFHGSKESDFKPVEKWFAEHPDATTYEPDDKNAADYGKKIGESFNDFANRVAQAHEDITKNYPPAAKVITHGYVRKVLGAIEQNGGVWDDKAKDLYLNSEKPEGITLQHQEQPADNTNPTGVESSATEPTGDGTVNQEPAETTAQTGTPEVPTQITKEALAQDWKNIGIDNPYADQMTRDWGGTVMNEAWQKINSGDVNPDQLATDIAAGKKNPANLNEDTQNAILLINKRRIDNRMTEESAAHTAAINSGDEAAAEESRLKMAGLMDRQQTNLSALEQVGSGLGRGLNSLKMAMASDYSLATMLAKKQATTGEKLSQKQIDDITAQHQKLQDAMGALDARVAKLEQARSEKDAQATVDGMASETKKQKRVVQRAALQQERAELITNIKSKLGAITSKLAEKTGGKLGVVADEALGNIPKELIGDITDLAKNYVRDGATRAQDVVDKVYDDLKGYIDGLTKDHVRNAIGYNQRLQGIKTRAVNKGAELQGKIEAGDYSPRKIPVTPLDAEALKLKANVERIKSDYDAGLEDDRLAKRTIGQKIQDAFIKWYKFGLLSNPVTLAKLTSAAGWRMAITPIETGVGFGLKQLPIIDQIAAKAPREGGANLKIEAQALAKGFTQGIIDMGQIATKVSSDLDVVFGGERKMPPEVLEYAGVMHKALKSTAFRNEFERSFAYRSEFEMTKENDMSDPMMQMRVGNKAYQDAERAVFKQKNPLASKFNLAVNALDNAGGGQKLIATALKVLLPFTRIPTNIAAETGQYTAGIGIGAWQIKNALRNGLENLGPDEADSIMRNLKKGTIGAGTLMLLGYFNSKNVGGSYQKGIKNKEAEPAIGSMRINGVDIPSYLIHNPLLEQMQLGATVRRVQDHYMKKEGAVESLGTGVMASLVGLGEEVPFVKTPIELGRLAFSPGERSKYLSEIIKNSIEPQIVQWAAQQLDRDKAGNKIKRDPKDFKTTMESGIPVLRQNVKEDVRDLIKRRRLEVTKEP